MMTSRLQLVFGIAIVLILNACSAPTNGLGTANKGDSNQVVQAEPKPSEVDIQQMDLDLSSKGIPLIVSVPAGSEVSEGMMHAPINDVMNYDILINKDRFKLEVSLMDEAPENTISEVIAMNKAADRGDEDFHRFLLEEATGYITELEIDGELDYRCFFILEKNQRHIEMTEGLSMKSYSESEIKAIYEASKTAH